MDQNDGINELGNHLLRHAGAVVVIIGEETKTGIQPSAAFAGFDQGQVKFRQPIRVAQSFGKAFCLGRVHPENVGAARGTNVPADDV